MSMPSDLAATSSLLLQLLILQGFTLQSSSAPDPIADPGPPLGSSRTPCSHLPLPKVQAFRPAVFPYYSPRLREKPPPLPPLTFFSF